MSTANAIIAHCLAHAARPVGVVVLDAHGSVLAFQAHDGAPLLAFALARGRAWGALGVGAGSRYFERMADARPHLLTALARAAGGVSGTAGGVLVCSVADSGDAAAAAAAVVVACVGVAGDSPDADERVAIAGIEKAGFVAKFD